MTVVTMKFMRMTMMLICVPMGPQAQRVVYSDSDDHTPVEVLQRRDIWNRWRAQTEMTDEPAVFINFFLADTFCCNHTDANRFVHIQTQGPNLCRCIAPQYCHTTIHWSLQSALPEGTYAHTDARFVDENQRKNKCFDNTRKSRGDDHGVLQERRDNRNVL